MTLRFIVSLAFAFILLTVQSKASDPKCEEKEKSLAALDLAVDSLSKAKDLYPNCEDENEDSNSSECGNKDKSLGYIDVAMDLVTEAKKSFPVCPPPPPPPPTPSPPEIDYLHRSPMDCQDLLEDGHTESGVYPVYPRSRIVAEGTPVDVRCDMDTDGGGWTVIQRRGNFTKQENFNRDWADYKNGFGNLSRDFWIGNDNIFALSNQGAYSLRFDMTDVDGNSAHETFRDFWIDDENSNYILHLGDASGTAGDSMAYHNGRKFSTKDRKNDNHTESCAILRQSGFWYHKCSHCNPNGLYRPGAKNDTAHIYYSSWKGFDGLFSMEMKMRRS